MPHNCPVCGSVAKRFNDEVARRCINAQCPAQVKQRLEHWGSRSAMNIKGLGTKLVNKLVENGILNKISEIYKLGKDTLKNVERMGEKSAQNLLEEIEQSKSRGLEKVLYGLGITYVGEHVARILAEEYEDIYKIMDANQEELEEIEEIGPKIAESVVSFFSDKKNQELVKRLDNYGVVMKKEDIQAEQFLEGKTFVLTGALDKFTRAEASEKIEKFGGRATSSVSGNTDFLIVGENPGSKLDKAKKIGIRILNEEQFLEILEKKSLP